MTNEMSEHDFTELSNQLEQLIKDEPCHIPNLANASAFIYQHYEDMNWVGFYLLCDNELVLGPFQGKPACIRIGIGKGVCGQSALLGKTMNVPDVHKFKGHIACDGDSNSELVIPLFNQKGLVGVLDIDSPKYDRFTQTSQKQLEELAGIIQKYCFNRTEL